MQGVGKAFTEGLPRDDGITTFRDVQNLTRQIPEQLVSLLRIGDGLDDLQVILT